MVQFVDLISFLSSLFKIFFWFTFLLDANEMLMLFITFTTHPLGTFTITMNWIPPRLFVILQETTTTTSLFTFMLFTSEVYILVLFKYNSFNSTSFFISTLAVNSLEDLWHFGCDRDSIHKHFLLSFLWDRYLYFETSYKWSVHLQTSIYFLAPLPGS